MPRVEIRDATLPEVIAVLDRLRDADKTEIWHASRSTPSQVAIPCYTSGAKVGMVDGTPATIFGCLAHKGIGVPWLLGTEDVLKVPVKFVRSSKKIVDAWLEEYGVLANYIHAENTVSLKWLTWLGFEIVDEVTINGQQFYRFERRLDHV